MTLSSSFLQRCRFHVLPRIPEALQLLGCVANGVDNRFNISGRGFFCRMDLQLCDYLYVRHSSGSAERLRKEGLSAEIYKVSVPPFYCNIFTMIIKTNLSSLLLTRLTVIFQKWKRRWVVLSANISPSKCSLIYCKKETDWLSNKQSEISKCQLTGFSVQNATGRGKHDNHLIISLHAYDICLSFESVTKMEQWYKALERMLGRRSQQLLILKSGRANYLINDRYSTGSKQRKSQARNNGK